MYGFLSKCTQHNVYRIYSHPLALSTHLCFAILACSIFCYRNFYHSAFDENSHVQIQKSSQLVFTFKILWIFLLPKIRRAINFCGGYGWWQWWWWCWWRSIPKGVCSLVHHTIQNMLCVYFSHLYVCTLFNKQFLHSILHKIYKCVRIKW